MKLFMDKDFLLESNAAKELYHHFVEGLPLFDYHCHLPAKEIAQNRPFDSIGELWLAHDHYKWRMMRSCGISEELITGEATWYEKYMAFASALPYAVGNPIYHWTHLELQRYFGVFEPLNSVTAQVIWDKTKAMLLTGSFTPKYFMESSNVDTVCTTDDPVDSLDSHRRIAESDLKTRVVPAWRPDKVLKLNEPGYPEYISRLSGVSKIRIADFTTLIRALEKRMDAFDKAGCFASDHDMSTVFYEIADDEIADSIFKRALCVEKLTEDEISIFKATLLCRMCESYYKRNWVMELHVGCNRSVNELGVKMIGRSSGFDSPGDQEIAEPLGALLNQLNLRGILPKTILFCMNPKDNWVLASLATTFQAEGIPSKIQFGTAWWMQDHIPGMVAQMEALANTGVFGHFVGMLTDSRSYLSYTRFEYFRRVMCNYLGRLVECGQYPADMNILGEIARNIS
ncbi:MAG: glucuronate isomerase, partial [Clostridium sp.]|nr:glucuronate isomerase [Clostridium sp.]